MTFQFPSTVVPFIFFFKEQWLVLKVYFKCVILPIYVFEICVSCLLTWLQAAKAADHKSKLISNIGN